MVGDGNALRALLAVADAAAAEANAAAVAAS